MKTATRSGPREEDRPDLWRDSMVVSLIIQRAAGGDPIKRSELSLLGKQVADAIAIQLGVRSIFEATSTCTGTILKRFGNSVNR